MGFGEIAGTVIILRILLMILEAFDSGGGE